MSKSWFVYILHCLDGSFYTGVTTDLKRRFKEHKSRRGAKYTRAKGVCCFHYSCEFHDRSEAMIEEARIKRLCRNEKENLVGDIRYK